MQLEEINEEIFIRISIPFSSGRNYRSTSSRWVFAGPKWRIFQFQNQSRHKPDQKRSLFQFRKECRHKIPLEQINEEIFIRISISLS